MDVKELTAPCGLDCFNCVCYLANDNEEIAKQVMSSAHVSRENVVCKGCRKENGIIPIRSAYGHNEPCKVVKCVSAKGIESCAACADFPCDNLHPFADRAAVLPHNIKVYNLALIRKDGPRCLGKRKSKKRAGNVFPPPVRNLGRDPGTRGESGTGQWYGTREIVDDVISEFSGMGKGKSSSTMAGIMAMRRFSELRHPEDERICYDPYAVRFISPEMLCAAAEHPDEAKAKAKEVERLFPGLGNSIIARVRYFDDYAERSVLEGIRQLVILGAGYDTRAYRLKSVKEQARVFELDQPDTQRLKVQKVSEIFGTLPGHVTYVPIDLATEDLTKKMERSGFSRTKKSLFMLEGLLMYIPPAAVDVLLGRIRQIAAPGSRIIFDYYPASVVYGSDKSAFAENIRNFCRSAGEPLQFGPPDDGAIGFLADRGFVNARTVTGAECRALYFTGKRSGRPSCDLLPFVHAEVP